MAARFIVILEDHAGRTAAMRRALAHRAAEWNVVIFPSAGETCRFLDQYLPQTSLISLDHDLLWPSLTEGGDFSQGADPGTGRDVADYLTRFPCVCPVIVHSSNEQAAQGMLRVLREARWACSQVVPTDGEAWIGNEWLAEVELYRARGLMFW